MNIYHLDYETFSRANISKVGAYRYACDDSTEIILASIARNDEPPLIWDYSSDNRETGVARKMLEEAVSNPENLIYAFNAPFEIAISHYLWEQTFGCPPPKMEQWRCVQAMARRAAMPSDLGQLEAAIRDEKLAYEARKKGKDAVGKQLIRIFCCPRSTGKLKGQRISPTDEGLVTVQGEKILIADAWKRFREYNCDDVMKEQRVFKSLIAFNLKGTVLKSFQMDLCMNHRGFKVNLDALKKAQVIVEEASKLDITRSFKLSGLVPTQVTKLLPWLNERGYPGDNLQEETTDGVLTNPPEDLTPEALEVLQIRSRVAFSAVKKLPTMLEAACKDGRIRGGLKWSGAIRTHRWTGQIVQPQNFKRPSVKDTHSAYQHICDGWDHEMLGIIYGNPVEVVASCIRHFIHDEERQILDADFSNIEARITPWLSGQEDMMDTFRKLDACKVSLSVAKKLGDEGAILSLKNEVKKNDPYTIMAGKIFGKEPFDCNDDERFVGKQAVLGCGFQVGGEKFQAMCAKYGRDLDIDLCNTTVSIYREQNDKISSMWKAMANAAVQAIKNPGSLFTVRGKITFGMSTTLPFPALMMRLPSGHHLVYPYPRIKFIWIFKKKKYESEPEAEMAYQRARAKKTLEEGDRVWKTTQITFFGPDPVTHQWGRQSSYGGKLLENAVQATAGDFIAFGAIQAESRGYHTFLLIHDQALATYRPEAGNTVEGFKKALCTLPPWAKDFPLEATCDIAPFYTKDS